MQIKKDTWLSATDQAHARELLYDILEGMEKGLCKKLDDIKSQCTCRLDQCTKRFVQYDEKFNKIEHRKIWNTMASAGGGIVGGFVAMLTKMVFWK